METTSPAKDKKPNFILVNCDDLGYGDLQCYGSTRNSTPALDRMAAEGMRFTDFYMASSLCSPSRGAMMTGCYPRRIDFGSFEGKWVLFPGQGKGLSPEEVTIAAMLKKAGYATKMVGKWHCGDQPAFLPTRHGFDSYFGLPFSNDMGRQINTERDFPPLPLLRDEEVIQEQPEQASLTERYVEECVRFIRDHRDQPFFLYLAQMHVHLPIYAPQYFLDRSQNGAYGAAVACIDWSVNTLLHELRRWGLDTNTLVIFTSDNGARGDYGGSNGGLRGAKATTWEGGFRVPCIARWPGVIPAGSTCSEVTASIDFFPTFAHLAGLDVPQERAIDGHDISALLQGAEGGSSPHEAFFYYRQDDLEAVRSGRWKLHVSKGGQPIYELYDLIQDTGETRNLVETYPEIVAALEKHLQRCREELGDARLGLAGTGCRAAGYVANPQPLTAYDPNHPYINEMYDLSDRG